MDIYEMRTFVQQLNEKRERLEKLSNSVIGLKAVTYDGIKVDTSPSGSKLDLLVPDLKELKEDVNNDLIVKYKMDEYIDLMFDGNDKEIVKAFINRKLSKTEMYNVIVLKISKDAGNRKQREKGRSYIERRLKKINRRCDFNVI